METHPALLKVIKATLCVHQFQTAHFQEIKRCEQLKKSWKQVQDATKTSKDPKLQKRMQHAKELYEAADAQCKAELDKTEKLFRNQTLLWKMYQDIQLEHCRYVESRIRRSMDSITTKEDKTVDLWLILISADDKRREVQSEEYQNIAQFESWISDLYGNLL